jgi:hypothetical protein
MSSEEDPNRNPSENTAMVSMSRGKGVNNLGRSRNPISMTHKTSLAVLLALPDPKNDLPAFAAITRAPERSVYRESVTADGIKDAEEQNVESSSSQNAKTKCLAAPELHPLLASTHLPATTAPRIDRPAATHPSSCLAS